MTPPDTFEALLERWRTASEVDREKNVDMNARLQRGETVMIETVPYGPYKDQRETCADELESLVQRVRELRDELARPLDGRMRHNPLLVARYEARNQCADRLTALLGKESAK